MNLSSGLNLDFRLNNTTPTGSFLKGCTRVCRPSRLPVFWNKEKQTCRQLEAPQPHLHQNKNKKNNMHYSWLGSIQRLLVEIDKLTHNHWCQSLTHDRSWRYQGETLGYCCMCIHLCIHVCLCVLLVKSYFFSIHKLFRCVYLYLIMPFVSALFNNIL